LFDPGSKKEIIMDYQEGKRIVIKLETGLHSGVPAVFGPEEADAIRNLIANDMVSPLAFAPSEKQVFHTQNIAESVPVTSKGTQLFL
jgi:hypothetical protein